MQIDAAIDFRNAIRALLVWAYNMPAADAERVGLDQAAMLRDVAQKIEDAVRARNPESQEKPDENHTPKQFANTACSQCGRVFGWGNSGFSHCENHLPFSNPHGNIEAAVIAMFRCPSGAGEKYKRSIYTRRERVARLIADVVTVSD